ncbi:hypothetical protein [Streptomyces sp. NPDC057438]|uniref:hypothetical protein n=1 Tax=Streptomyces sp. NPDC057438 TaxID=3346133 RepID=UPI0036A4A031
MTQPGSMTQPDTEPPRAYRRRRGRAWALLAGSLVMLVMGMVLPQGLLLASGLVTAGMATHLLAPPDHPERPDVSNPPCLCEVPDRRGAAGDARADRAGSAPTGP